MSTNITEKENINQTVQDLTEQKKLNLQEKAEAYKAQKMFEELEEASGKGFIDSFTVDKSQLKDVDMFPILEKALSNLGKTGKGKDPADIVMGLMADMLLVVGDLLNNYFKEVRKNQKENAKIKIAQRQNYISDNLKANGSSMRKLALTLSHQVQNWLLNDPRYQNLPAKPKTRFEHLMTAKKNFADNLPKNKDGSINFSKMSLFQKRRYLSYVSVFARSNTWLSYATNMAGLKLTRAEHSQMIDAASKIRSNYIKQHSREVA